MSISTQLTRLARNVGALTADTNAIFEALRAKGVDVPANAQLSDVADLIEGINPPHQTDDLVSSTPGDQMLDSDTPVDFSGKGIQTGTPCGIVDWDCCPGEMMPRYAITAGDLSNGATIEVWYKSDYSVQVDDSYPWLIAMDSTTNNYVIILSAETENGSGTAGHQLSLLFTLILLSIRK